MEPDICPFCTAKLVRVGDGDPYHYWAHRNSECILPGFTFADTPENVAKWNRRTGKPLWAKEPR